MTEVQPWDYYFGQWQQFLAYGSMDAQLASMYALRSHGWECIGEGYREEFLWMVRRRGSTCWCLIDPEQKDRQP